MKSPMPVKQLRLALLLIAGAGSSLSGANAPVITRSAYLQLGTPHGVDIRWRTAQPTDSRVRYGSTPGALTGFVDSASQVTDHDVKLTGLLPDTKYYYSVGSTTTEAEGNDSNHYFYTNPLQGAIRPMRFWVLGDSGTADVTALATRDAYYFFAGTQRTDAWLMLGDNAYSNGTDAEYQAAVFNTFQSTLRTSVLWPTIGNHDTAESQNPPLSLPYFNIFTLPALGEAGGVPSGTNRYYSFDYGNVHFICLDSMTSGRTPGSPMLTWLQQDLAADHQRWTIAFWHHAPYASGVYASDQDPLMTAMRSNVLPILEAGGVDLVLSGHIHQFERSYLIDGHYGLSSTFQPSMKIDGGTGQFPPYNKAAKNPHEGTVYVLAGSSGRDEDPSNNAPKMPASYLLLHEFGSVVLDVNGDVLSVTFLSDSAVIRDSFSIHKGVPVAPTSDSINPNTGSGSTRLFQAVYSDTSGSPAIQSAYVLFNNAVSAVNACLTLYYQPTNSLYLFNDAGAAAIGPLTPGVPGTLQNSQCILDGGGSSISVSGNSLTVKPALTFKPAFNGLKNEYLYATDWNNLNSGWQNRGTWTAFAATPPKADSINPNAGSGATQLFQGIFSDAGGWAAIQSTYLLFNNSISAVNTCLVWYHQSSNSLYLFNDAGTGLLGPLTPGVAGTVQNNQCMLDGGGSAIARSGNSLTVKAALTFKPTYTGPKNEYLYVNNANGLNSGWQNGGTWTPFPAVPPTADSISPNTGFGSTQLFQAAYSDVGGSAAIQWTYLLFNNVLSAANTCLVLYYQPNNSLYLLNDAGTAWLGTLTTGVPGTVQNSQCTLDGGASSIVVSSTTLTVRPALTFNAGFSGSKIEYLYVSDVNNLTSGWQNRGTWTVP